MLEPVEMLPSSRGRSLQTSPIRRIAPLAENAESRGLRVYYLNIGQPDLPPPPGVTSALDQASSVRLAYAPSRGLPDAVKAWVGYYRRYGIELETTDILVTAGASEALSLAFLTTCDPGDDVLVPEPFYAPYKGVASISGVRLVPVPAREEFSPATVEQLEQSITPRTRAILIASPNNPTGTVYSHDDLSGIGSFARKHGLFLLSDETYREIVFNGPAAPSALSIPGLEEIAVAIDSLSKRFNVCGIRIGSLVTRNEGVMTAAMELAELRLAVPAVEQHAAIAALTTPERYLSDLAQTYQHRVEVVVDALEQVQDVSVRRPDGAFYVVPRLPIDDAELFASWLLADFSHEGATVMVTPMSDFYATPGRGRDEIRLACILDQKELSTAIEVLRVGLSHYPGRRTRS